MSWGRKIAGNVFKMTKCDGGTNLDFFRWLKCLNSNLFCHKKLFKLLIKFGTK